MGIAIMAVDPGGKSGVSWGWFNDEANSVHSALLRARKRGSLFAVELSGTPESQAWWIARQWTEFHFHSTVELGCRSEDVVLVIEDFELRQRNVELQAPMIICALKTLLQNGRLASREGRDKKTDGIVVFTKTVTHVNGKKTDENFWKLQTATAGYPVGQPILQKASTAKSFATNKRLRDWGVWLVGSEHMRDALRHLAAKLNQMLD